MKDPKMSHCPDYASAGGHEAETTKQPKGKEELLQSGVHKELVDEILKLLMVLDGRKLEIVHRFIKTLI